MKFEPTFLKLEINVDDKLLVLSGGDEVNFEPVHRVSMQVFRRKIFLDMRFILKNNFEMRKIFLVRNKIFFSEKLKLNLEGYRFEKIMK